MNKTFEHCTLLDTKTWFDKARPHKTISNFTVQLGVHFEEVAESLEVLDGNTVDTNVLIGNAHAAMHALAEHLKANSQNSPVSVTSPLLFLDALCDQIVTGTGVAHTLDYDIVGAMTEVNRSNFSKFDEAGLPIYNEQGKVMKGPNYTVAELSAYLPQ
jgi:hypothetical protein